MGGAGAFSNPQQMGTSTTAEHQTAVVAPSSTSGAGQSATIARHVLLPPTFPVDALQVLGG